MYIFFSEFRVPKFGVRGLDFMEKCISTEMSGCWITSVARRCTPPCRCNFFHPAHIKEHSWATRERVYFCPRSISAAVSGAR